MTAATVRRTVGFNLVLRRYQTDVGNVGQIAKLHELFVAERHRLIVERRRQDRGDDAVGCQCAKAVRCTAGVDGADILFVDF